MTYRDEQAAIRAGQLILKEMEGQPLSLAEQTELRLWLDATPENQAVYERLKTDNNPRALLETLGRYDSAKSLQRLLPRLKAKTTWRISRSGIAIAATLLLMVSVGIGLYLRSERSDIVPSLSSQYGGDALPGTNRATLTLANGTTVDLDSTQSGIIVYDENITYQDGTSLALSPAGGGRGRIEDIEELVLTTPVGGTYQVALPDGSKVWLNAGSTLKYPSRFSGEERIVELEGEGYFEVNKIAYSPFAIRHSQESTQQKAHSKSQNIPFLVKTQNQVIEVLGTQFNISAYPDKAATKTTLVEGSVSVAIIGEAKQRSENRDSPHTGSSDFVLTPGQQSTLLNGNTTINEVDVIQYTAWRDGLFVFHNLSLPEVLDQLGRWYGITVQYGDLPDVSIYGEISRNTNLSNVLALVEAATDVRFELTEGRLYIVN